MARLIVSATIHPKTGKYVLVSVEDDAGGPVKLSAGDFAVTMWAANAYPPSAWLPIPVVDVQQVWSTNEHTFLQLELDGATVYGPEAQAQGVWPVEVMGPITYAIAVDTGDDHGQAIACACCVSLLGEFSAYPYKRP